MGRHRFVAHCNAFASIANAPNKPRAAVKSWIWHRESGRVPKRRTGNQAKARRFRPANARPSTGQAKPQYRPARGRAQILLPGVWFPPCYCRGWLFFYTATTKAILVVGFVLWFQQRIVGAARLWAAISSTVGHGVVGAGLPERQRVRRVTGARAETVGAGRRRQRRCVGDRERGHAAMSIRRECASEMHTLASP